MSNGSPIIASSTEVSLSGSFSGATSQHVEAGFWYGTSSNSLNNYIAATVASSTSTADGYDGTFTATLSGLTTGQTYVFQSCVTVAGTGTYVSQTAECFAPSSAYFTMPGGGNDPAVNKDWLELPSGLKGSQYVVNTYYSGERNYTHLYDTSMMTSLWTAYPLNSSHMGSLSRPSWDYSPSIPRSYQADLTSHSYSGSTYSRGHMCPNGSRNGNATMQKQTFYVTNQVPQIQNNFNSGIWSNLENAVQSLAKREEIYVVTGVAFHKVGESKTVNYVSPADNSSQKCPIPNYFYKLVLRVKYSGSAVTDARAIGFWMEHKAYTGDSYVNYTVSVDQIEQWTGFDFFVNLPDLIESSAESATLSWSDFTAW